MRHKNQPTPKTNNALFTISGLIIIGALVFMLVNDDWKNLFTSKTKISVFLNSSMCEQNIERTDGYNCKKHEALTTFQSELITWPYKSQKECETDYGICTEKRNMHWSPIKLGFGLLKLNDQYQSIPIFYSIKLGKYLMPSGFPVNTGDNWIENFPINYIEMLKIPAKFDQTMCFKMSTGQEICKSRNDLLEDLTDENINMLLYFFVGHQKN
jgi:hypothetical protein